MSAAWCRSDFPADLQFDSFSSNFSPCQKEHFHYTSLLGVLASASSSLKLRFFALLHPSHLSWVDVKLEVMQGKPVNNSRHVCLRAICFQPSH